MARLQLEDVLSRLVWSYERGRLVPFIGAGLSHPACRLWCPFVKQLEKAAKTDVSHTGGFNSDDMEWGRAKVSY